MSNVNAGHRQRMRDRMQKEGLKGFKDHELLEMLLYQSLPRQDTNKLAHTLLQKFGNLRNVLNAGVDELMMVKGISQITACNLSMLKEVTLRCKQQEKKMVKLGSVSDILSYARLMIAESYAERLVIVYVDRGTKILFREEFAATTNDHNLDVDLKELVTTALRLKASGLMVFHCHVEGDCNPSQNDLNFTEKLMYAFSGLEIVVLEHLIFNPEGDYFSFYEQGLLDKLNEKITK